MGETFATTFLLLLCFFAIVIIFFSLNWCRGGGADVKRYVHRKRKGGDSGFGFNLWPELQHNKAAKDDLLYACKRCCFISSRMSMLHLDVVDIFHDHQKEERGEAQERAGREAGDGPKQIILTVKVCFQISFENISLFI